MAKYMLLKEETKVLGSRTLYRIKAIKDFGDVKEGDVGGWIEKEENLSQTGLCWVYDDARVYGNGCIYGNTKIYRYNHVYGNFTIFGKLKFLAILKIFVN